MKLTSDERGFEMRPAEMTADYGIAIPYSEPTRYVIASAALKTSRPDICCLLLTGEAYDSRNEEDRNLPEVSTNPKN